MTHQCRVTCHVAFFMLITIAFSLVTCLTSTTMLRVLQKWGIAQWPQELAVCLRKPRACQISPAACSPLMEPAAPSWALRHPPSLRGDICFFCELHGCPTGKSTTEGVLNWPVSLANQVPCWLSFCFSPTYLGWRLTGCPQSLQLTEEVPSSTLHCNIPSWPSVAPLLLLAHPCHPWRLHWKLYCPDHCQNTAHSVTSLFPRTDQCSVHHKVIVGQRSNLLWSCSTVSLFTTFYSEVQAQILSERSWSWVNTGSVVWANKDFPLVQIQVWLHYDKLALYKIEKKRVQSHLRDCLQENECFIYSLLLYKCMLRGNKKEKEKKKHKPPGGLLKIFT